MIGTGRVLVIAIVLVAAGPAAAQVINGESTYGDSDLHQPPEETPPPAEKARQNERAQDRRTPEQR